MPTDRPRADADQMSPLLEARHRAHAAWRTASGSPRTPVWRISRSRASCATRCDSPSCSWPRTSRRGTQLLCLDGELARVEPKRLRYCLLHAAGPSCVEPGGSSCACRGPGRGRLDWLARLTGSAPCLPEAALGPDAARPPSRHPSPSSTTTTAVLDPSRGRPAHRPSGLEHRLRCYVPVRQATRGLSNSPG